MGITEKVHFSGATVPSDKNIFTFNPYELLQVKVIE